MVSAEGGERGGGLRGEQRSGRAALGSDRAVWAGPIFPSLGGREQCPYNTILPKRHQWNALGEPSGHFVRGCGFPGPRTLGPFPLQELGAGPTPLNF